MGFKSADRPPPANSSIRAAFRKVRCKGLKLNFRVKPELYDIPHVRFDSYKRGDPPGREAALRYALADENLMKSMFAYAEARERALLLAEEIDGVVLGLARERRGVRSRGDDRRPPVVWN